MRRSPSDSPRFVSTALAALVAAAPELPAQEPAAEFGATVDVRVVNVEVVVTGRDGEPVAGLDRGDFELRVDGEVVPIVNFYAAERTPGRAAAPPATTLAPTPDAVPAHEPPARAGQPLRLVVWIDDLSLLPAHRNRALRELAGFLAEQQRRGTEILIARFDRALEIVRPFAAGDRPLDAELADLQRRAATGVFADVERRITLQEIRRIHAESGCSEVERMLAAAAQYAQTVSVDWSNQLEQLARWLGALAGLEGRKALLYVSDGVPLDPGYEPLLLVGELCGQPPGPSVGLADALRRVTRAANAAGVAFYTVSAAGLRVEASAENALPMLSAGGAFLQRANLSDPLFNLASETGGRALLESNRIEPLLAGLVRDLESFYSLGFEPEGEPDGSAHRIEVRVLRDGLRARHRSSFTDRPAAARASDRLQAALRFGGASDPIGVEIETGEARSLDAKTAVVPVRILVPARDLVFLPGEEGSAARLEMAVVASDAEGGQAAEQQRTLSVARAKLAERLEDAVVRIPLELEMRKGPAVIAVAVRDLGGATEAIVRREIVVR